MIDIYCPKCLAFAPLVFDEPYPWEGAVERNVICPQCQTALSILKGEGAGAHVLQKMAELAYYALPIDPLTTGTTPPPSVGKRSRKDKRRLKLVP